MLEEYHVTCIYGYNIVFIILGLKEDKIIFVLKNSEKQQQKIAEATLQSFSVPNYSPKPKNIFLPLEQRTKGLPDTT